MTLVGLVIQAVAFPASLLALLLIVVRAVLLRPMDPAVDAAWLTGGAYRYQAGVEVLSRYLWRVRSHRISGAVIGGGLAPLEGLTEYRRVSIGIGGPGWSPLADVLFGGLAGLLVGSLLAETWRIRIRGTIRQAEIAPRGPDVGAISLRPAVACLTAVTVALGFAVGQRRGLVLEAASTALLVVHRSHWIVTWLSLASLVGTVVLLRRSRPWPPRRLRRAPTPSPGLAT